MYWKIFFSDNKTGKAHLELLWNVLAIFYENIGQSKNDSPNRIDYTIPKEFIWKRRRNLNGAELRIGYVHSPPYLRLVNAETEILTGNELTYGNTVNANKL